jgi:hypothetical protein
MDTETLRWVWVILSSPINPLAGIIKRDTRSASHNKKRRQIGSPTLADEFHQRSARRP